MVATGYVDHPYENGIAQSPTDYLFHENDQRQFDNCTHCPDHRRSSHHHQEDPLSHVATAILCGLEEATYEQIQAREQDGRMDILPFRMVSPFNHLSDQVIQTSQPPCWCPRARVLESVQAYQRTLKKLKVKHLAAN